MPPKSKLQPIILDELRGLLEGDELKSVIMTDEDLFLELNDKLEPENRVSYRTFQRYKRHAMRYGEEEMPQDIDPLYEELYNIIRHAQLRQKRTLFNNMMNCSMQEWHRLKWILERKFPDFNITQINRAAEAEARQMEAIEAAETKAMEEAKPKKAPQNLTEWMAQMPYAPKGEAKYIEDDVYFGEEGYEAEPVGMKRNGQEVRVAGGR